MNLFFEKIRRLFFEKAQFQIVRYQGRSYTVLRDDLIHPVMSGNKLRKLWLYLQRAFDNRKGILTFGGPYSNHLVATAYATSAVRIPSMAYICRGYQKTETLDLCEKFGMKLIPTDKNTYSQLKRVDHWHESKWISVPEGGMGPVGIDAVKMSYYSHRLSDFDEIWLAAGTLTTAIGVALAAPGARVVAVPVLKATGQDLMRDYEKIYRVKKPENLFFSNEYHFGRYAGWNQDLLTFANEWYLQTGIMTDLVYTAKAFYACSRDRNSPPDVSKLLIHTGGLQGMVGILPQIKKKNLQLVYETPLVAHLSDTHRTSYRSKYQ